MKLVIASDIHLEKSNTIEPALQDGSGKTLALLGDIGNPQHENYLNFIEKCVTQYKFERVFVLAGNHEFYGGEYYSTRRRIQWICSKYENVHFLDRTSMLFEEAPPVDQTAVRKIRILGCTLWSDIKEEHSSAITQSVNDYKFIAIRNENIAVEEEDVPLESMHRITTQETTQFHKQDVTWLTSEIMEANERGEVVVVLTHHAPLTRQTSNPMYKHSELNSAFSSDLTYLMDRNRNVAVWAFGHTHFNCSFTKKKTLVVSNQLGYHREKGNTKPFDPNFVIEI